MTDTGKSLKERLEEWNSFFDSFGNLLPGGLGVFECTENLYPIYLSPGVISLCNGFDDDFYRRVQENMQRMLLEGESEKLNRAMEKSLETGKILDCTLRFKKTPRRDGWIWIRGRFSQENDYKKLFFAIILDVTKQKELESELLIQNERYRILEETSDEMLYELNLREDILTYSYKEMDGDFIRKRIPHYSQMLEKDSLVHPDSQEIFEQHLRIAKSRKINGTLEYLSRISGHGYEWSRNCYSSLLDDDGKVSRIIGRIKNIHDEVLQRQKKQMDLEFGLGHISGIKQRIWEKLENAEFDDKHTMAIVSLNHYKRIIEQNGVAWGDTAIREIADILRGVLAERAIMGRMSDGEIVLYFKNICDAEMDAYMDEIIRQVQLPEHKVAGVLLGCTIGASVMYGIVDYTSFFQAAEEALHIAKITKGEHYIRV